MESLGEQCVVFEVPRGGSVREVVRRLSSDPRVSIAQTVETFQTQGGDPYAHLQHGSTTLRLDQAHRWATGKGVKVAVVDTGVDFDHPDLRERVKKAQNFVDRGRAQLHQRHPRHRRRRADRGHGQQRRRDRRRGPAGGDLRPQGLLGAAAGSAPGDLQQLYAGQGGGLRHRPSGDAGAQLQPRRPRGSAARQADRPRPGEGDRGGGGRRRQRRRRTSPPATRG